MGHRYLQVGRELDEIEANLALIAERKASYVLQVEVPLQIVKEERDLERRRADLQMQFEVLRGDTRCPYRGLAPFEVEHAEFFYGRRRMVEILVRRVERMPFVAVVGPSGCGKSSLARAGVIHTLRQAGGWNDLIFKPGRDPLHGLARQLVQWLLPDAGPVERLGEAEKLARGLHQGSVDLDPLLDTIEEWARGGRLLLAVDQFEEHFSRDVDDERRARFVEALFEMTRRRKVRVLVTLRADYFAHVLRDSRLAAAFDRGQVNVLPPTLEEVRETIERPAGSLGRVFEEGLVARILEDVAEASGYLPLLQFALTELWSRQTAECRLTHVAYDEIGGVEQALARYAEKVYELFPEDDQHRVQRILVQLVHVSGQLDATRRLANRSELGAHWDLVALLADERLVVTGREGHGVETAELVHETLIAGWKRLRGWIEDDRTFRVWQDRLRAALQQWQDNDRDPGGLLRGRLLNEAIGWSEDRGVDLSPEEQLYIQSSKTFREREELRRRRRRRWGIFSLLAGLLVALALAAVALFYAERAEERTRDVQQALREQARQARIAKSKELAAQSSVALKDFPQRSLLLAVESIRAADETRSFVPEAEASLRDALAHVGGRVLNVGVDGRNLHFGPKKRWMAAVAKEGVSLWDLDGAPLATNPSRFFERPPGLEASWDEKVRVSEGGRWMVWISPVRRRAALWDLQVAVQDLEIKPYLLGSSRAPVTDVHISADEQWLLFVYSTQAGRLPGISRHSPEEENIVRAFLLDELVADGDGASFRELRLREEVRALSFWPDRSRRLALVDAAGRVCIWAFGAEDPAGCRQVDRGGRLLTSFEISPNGWWAAAAAADDNKRKSYRLVLFDLRNGPPHRVAILAQSMGFVSDLLFSPDSRWLLAGFQGAVPRLWDLSGEFRSIRARELTGHDATVVQAITLDREGGGLLGGFSGVQYESYLSTAIFDPRSRWLVTGGMDGTARWWSLAGKSPEPGTRILSRHREPIAALAVSPDGRRLASAGGTHPNTLRTDNEIQVWNLADSGAGSYGVLRGHESAIAKLGFVANGDHLISVGEHDGSSRIWDLRSGSVHAVPVVLRVAGELTESAMSSDDRWLAAAGSGSSVHVWDLKKVAQPVGRRVLRGHRKNVTALAFSRDGRWLATGGGWDRTVRLWDLGSIFPERDSLVLRGFEGFVSTVAFDSETRFLIGASWRGEAYLWDLARLDPPVPKTILRHPQQGIDTMSVSPDGRWLVTGAGGMFFSNDNFFTGRDVYLWDLTAEDPALSGWRLGRHDSSVTAAAFSSDSQWLATGGMDHTILLWNLRVKDVDLGVTKLTGHEEVIEQLRMTPDGRRLVSSSQDGMVRLWELARASSRAEATVLRGHDDEVTATAISNGGRWLSTGSKDRTVRLWDLAAKDPATASFRLDRLGGEVHGLFFDATDEWLTIVAQTGEVHRWPLERVELLSRACDLAGRELSPEERQTYFPDGGADGICRPFSRDESRIPSGGNDRQRDRPSSTWSLSDSSFSEASGGPAPCRTSLPAPLEISSDRQRSQAYPGPRPSGLSHSRATFTLAVVSGSMFPRAGPGGTPRRPTEKR